MSSTRTPVAIALGSNLGDRASHLHAAVVDLGRVLTSLRSSPFYDTAPIGVAVEQPTFLNAAVVGECALDPRALLETLLAIEHTHGRTRPFPNAARTLDLDLVLYGHQCIDEPSLVVPHPRFRERRFVLEPLARIAPEMRDPVSGRTVAELLALLPPAPRAPRL